MPFNLPGLLAPFQLLFRPRVIVPSIAIKDIRQLNWIALREGGYRGIVFDKDNCLTFPYRDELVPELNEAWNECKTVFGREHVLIVSNSVGTKGDEAGIGADAVSHSLGVPVLRHRTHKPSYKCIRDIQAYFASFDPPVQMDELAIVGDRIFTDVILANRMQRMCLPQSTSRDNGDLNSETGGQGKENEVRLPLAIFTTDVWKKEGRVIRWMENGMARMVERWTASGERIRAKQELAARFTRSNTAV